MIISTVQNIIPGHSHEGTISRQIVNEVERDKSECRRWPKEVHGDIDSAASANARSRNLLMRNHFVSVFAHRETCISSASLPHTSQPLDSSTHAKSSANESLKRGCIQTTLDCSNRFRGYLYRDGETPSSVPHSLASTCAEPRQSVRLKHPISDEGSKVGEKVISQACLTSSTCEQITCPDTSVHLCDDVRVAKAMFVNVLDCSCNPKNKEAKTKQQRNMSLHTAQSSRGSPSTLPSKEGEYPLAWVGSSEGQEKFSQQALLGKRVMCTRGCAFSPQVFFDDSGARRYSHAEEGVITKSRTYTNLSSARPTENTCDVEDHDYGVQQTRQARSQRTDTASSSCFTRKASYMTRLRGFSSENVNMHAHASFAIQREHKYFATTPTVNLSTTLTDENSDIESTTTTPRKREESIENGVPAPNRKHFHRAQTRLSSPLMVEKGGFAERALDKAGHSLSLSVLTEHLCTKVRQLEEENRSLRQRVSGSMQRNKQSHTTLHDSESRPRLFTPVPTCSQYPTSQSICVGSLEAPIEPTKDAWTNKRSDSVGNRANAVNEPRHVMKNTLLPPYPDNSVLCPSQSILKESKLHVLQKSPSDDFEKSCEAPNKVQARQLNPSHFSRKLSTSHLPIFDKAGLYAPLSGQDWDRGVVKGIAKCPRSATMRKGLGPKPPDALKDLAKIACEHNRTPRFRDSLLFNPPSAVGDWGKKCLEEHIPRLQGYCEYLEAIQRYLWALHSMILSTGRRLSYAYKPCSSLREEHSFHDNKKVARETEADAQNAKESTLVKAKLSAPKVNFEANLNFLSNKGIERSSNSAGSRLCCSRESRFIYQQACDSAQLWNDHYHADENKALPQPPLTFSRQRSLRSSECIRSVTTQSIPPKEGKSAARPVTPRFASIHSPSTLSPRSFRLGSREYEVHRTEQYAHRSCAFQPCISCVARSPLRTLHHSDRNATAASQHKRTRKGFGNDLVHSSETEKATMPRSHVTAVLCDPYPSVQQLVRTVTSATLLEGSPQISYSRSEAVNLASRSAQDTQKIFQNKARHGVACVADPPKTSANRRKRFQLPSRSLTPIADFSRFSIVTFPDKRSVRSDVLSKTNAVEKKEINKTGRFSLR